MTIADQLEADMFNYPPDSERGKLLREAVEELRKRDEPIPTDLLQLTLYARRLRAALADMYFRQKYLSLMVERKELDYPEAFGRVCGLIEYNHETRFPLS